MKGRVLLAGDTHGTTGWVLRLIEIAVNLGIKTIIQVGDFGYWSHKADGRRYIDAIQAAAAAAGITIIFIDGNHEYHSTHPAKPAHHRKGLQELTPDDDGWIRIADNVWYANRGHRFELDGVRFGALGGAVSLDRPGGPAFRYPERKKYTNWWWEESVRDYHVERLGTDDLDVLITHDAPDGHAVPDPDGHYTDRTVDPPSQEQRVLLAQAMKNTRPKLVVHGHWHSRYTHETAWIDADATETTGDLTWISTIVEGLGADITEGWEDDEPKGPETGTGWAVLDLNDLTVTSGTPNA